MVVLYRKYRPQKIAEIDNLAVREYLEKTLDSKEIPHAFLFTGPKGTGKTSSARIIAKSVNCERNNGKGEPCNKCPTCMAITNGTDLDVLEIDAASNRGIDEIRELRDKIRLAPSGNRKKVYIIDEVHMLTPEAFNALLKTLEEPPPHALFILCTTNLEKLPGTIISRCRQINFKKAKIDDMVVSLKRAGKGEDREVEPEALKEIARLSEGSYRDGHKLLEEVFETFPRARITAQIVGKTIGKDQFLVNDFLVFLANRQIEAALLWLEEAAGRGADLRFLTTSILEALHAYLLKKYGVVEENFDDEPVLDQLTVDDLKRLISLFSQAVSELKSAVIPQLPLELAVVEWCEEAQNMGHETQNINENVKQVKDLTPNPLLSGEGVGFPLFAREGQGEFHQWDDLLAAVKPYNHSVAGLLHSCRPTSFDGQELAVEVFYKFHYDKLSEPKVRELLDKAAEEVFKTKVRVIPEYKLKK